MSILKKIFLSKTYKKKFKNLKKYVILKTGSIIISKQEKKKRKRKRRSKVQK